MEARLKGVFTALVTPFDADGMFDEPTMRHLVDRQVTAGVAGLVPCGTTGESASMTPEEHQRVVETVSSAAAGRIPVIAGAGANNLRLALELSRRCLDAGADALLHVTPYYVKPTQRGLIDYYETLADATELPIVLYNVPGRTGVNLSPATILHLAQHPRIVALKQAVSELDCLNELLYARPNSLSVLSGEDALTLPMVAMGADGVISVVSNQVPFEMTQLVDAALRGERSRAMEIQRRLAPLMRANFLESNPIAVKFAMSVMGLMENSLRLPLTPLAVEYCDRMMFVLQNAGLRRMVGFSTDPASVRV